MNQKKIGSFLKKLRNEKGITQEQLAELMQVSGRTISRWENGYNMPDISLLVEIADFYDVEILEIINGERKSETMEKEVKEVAVGLSEYAQSEKLLLLKRVRTVSIIGLAGLTSGLIMEFVLADSMTPIYGMIKGFCLGLGLGALITTVLYTTGVLEKIRGYKKKLFQH